MERRALTTGNRRDSDGGIGNAADYLQNVRHQALEVHRVEGTRCIRDPQILGIAIIEVQVRRTDEAAENDWREDRTRRPLAFEDAEQLIDVIEVAATIEGQSAGP
jgi:hypothetical protein